MSTTTNSEHEVELSCHTTLTKDCFMLHNFLFHTFSKKTCIISTAAKKKQCEKKCIPMYESIQSHHATKITFYPSAIAI